MAKVVPNSVHDAARPRGESASQVTATAPMKASVGALMRVFTRSSADAASSAHAGKTMSAWCHSFRAGSESATSMKSNHSESERARFEKQPSSVRGSHGQQCSASARKGLPWPSVRVPIAEAKT
ncbi:MAG: hypothetical protein QM817_00385 [Archangium sp.]